MKISLLTLFFCVTAAGVARAQESQVGLTTTLGQATSLGYQPNSLAVSFEVVQKLKRSILISNFSIGSARKAYLGNGWAISSSDFLRLPVSRGVWVEGGGRLVRQYTSEYRKTAFYPAVGAGYNFKNLVVPYLVYNSTDVVSRNQGHGWSGGSDLYLPLNSKWRARFRVELTRLSFTQPGRGHLAGTSFDIGLGFSRLTSQKQNR